MTPTPGFDDVDRDEADDERERRDDLEVDDRAQAHPADHLEVAGAGDAGDQRREDQRRDDHLDQAEEQLAERPEVDRPFGVERVHDRADDDAEHQTDEDLLGQGEAAARLRGGLSLVHESRCPPRRRRTSGFYSIICGDLRERRVRSERRITTSRNGLLDVVAQGFQPCPAAGQCVVIGPGASVIVSAAGVRAAPGRTQLRPCAFAWYSALSARSMMSAAC